MPTYGAGGHCACMPTRCSITAAGASSDRASRSWRATVARLSSRSVRTRSATRARYTAGVGPARPALLSLSRCGSSPAAARATRSPPRRGSTRARPPTASARTSSISSARSTARRVLDLYAGSGALGIEALSRGAARAVFVERDARRRAHDRAQPRPAPADRRPRRPRGRRHDACAGGRVGKEVRSRAGRPSLRHVSRISNPSSPATCRPSSPRTACSSSRPTRGSSRSCRCRCARAASTARRASPSSRAGGVRRCGAGLRPAGALAGEGRE